MKKLYVVIQVVIFSIIGTGCKDSGQSIDSQLQGIITEQGLTGNPTVGRTTTNISDPLSQLGMKLFFTKGNLHPAIIMQRLFVSVRQ